jgi:hypothetical protein
MRYTDQIEIERLKRSGKDKVAFGLAYRAKNRKQGMKTTPLQRFSKGGPDSKEVPNTPLAWLIE